MLFGVVWEWKRGIGQYSLFEKECVPGDLIGTD